MEFRPQYDTIRAAKIRQFNTGILGSLGGFSRVTDAGLKMQGFEIKGTLGNLLQKISTTLRGGGTFLQALSQRDLIAWFVKKNTILGKVLRSVLLWQW
jgi:hypothetical protein